MNVKIISPVVNSPSFLDIQITKFKENLSNDFELICSNPAGKLLKELWTHLYR